MRKLIEDGGDLKLKTVLSLSCISFSSHSHLTSSESEQTWPGCWTGGHVGQSNPQNWVLVDLNFNSKLNCPSFPPTRKSTRYSGMNQVDNNRSCILHCTACTEGNKTHNTVENYQIKPASFWRLLVYQFTVELQPASQQSSRTASLSFIFPSNFGKIFFNLKSNFFTNFIKDQDMGPGTSHAKNLHPLNLFWII